MRIFIRRSFYYLLLLTVVWLSRGIWQNFLGDVFGLSTSTADETNTSFVYRLEPGHDLVFSFPYTPVLRLITNATIPAGKEPPPGESLPYAIHYRLEDADGNVMESKPYHLAASLSHFKDPDSGRIYWDSFMEGKTETPMDGRITLINIDNIKKQQAPPRQLRLRLAEKDQRIRSVVVRVYQQLKYPAYKQKVRWQRKARKTKEHLARGNIYPVDLLTDSEKRNLAAAEWEVLAPQGVPGRDFHKENLYTLKEVTGLPIFPVEKWSNIETGVLYAGPNLRAIVPLPETGGLFRFHFKPVNIPGTTPHTSTGIRLTWFGRKPGTTINLTVPPQHAPTKETLFEKHLPGGLIEIQSPKEISITVETLNPPNQPTDITPQGTYLKSYQCEKTTPIEYKVFHPPIPVRVDLRTIITDEKKSLRRLSEGQGGAPLGTPLSLREVGLNPVAYEMLDDRNNVVGEGMMGVEPIPSLYDRPTDGGAIFNISEKHSYYILVPPGVRTIRFINDGEPVLVSVFNRPPGLRRQARVPEDDYDFHRQEETRKTREWFTVKPVNHQEMERSGKAFGLLLQPRPPQTAEHLLSGDYRWEAPKTVTPVWGRLLLVKRDNPIPPKPDTLPLLFRELPVKAPGTVASPEVYTFGEQYPPTGPAPATEITPVEPELVYYNPGGKLQSIRLKMDGTPYWDGRIGGTGGKLTLPPLPAGKHTMEAAGPEGMRLWLNRTQADISTSPDAAKTPLYFLRLVYKLGTSPMTFRFDKEMPEEMLGFQVFSPIGAAGRVSMEVKVKAKRRPPAKPYDNWTILHRTYDIRPAGGKGNPLLHTGGRRLDNGQTAFLPLGTDIAPGPLQVTLSFTGGPGYYVLPYRMIPGRFEESRVDIAPITSATAAPSKPDQKPGKVDTRDIDNTVVLETHRLRDAWENARKDVKYKPSPTAIIEHRQMTTLFERLMRQTITPEQSAGKPAHFPAQLHAAFKLQGWDLLKIEEDPTVVAVVESPERKEGRGFYLVRLGPAQPIQLQAPHSGSDKLTGGITMKLFREHNVKAAAFNTVHRKKIDQAHRYDTAFQAITLAFAAQHPRGRVIQWHGFNADVRPTKKGRNAAAIISNGTRTPSEPLTRTVQCLGTITGAPVYLYPTGISTLGGTTNSQGAALRKLRFYNFVHQELALPWRQRLNKEKRLRDKWFRCLTREPNE